MSIKESGRTESRGKQRAQEIKDAGGVMTHRQVMFVIVGLMAAMFLSSLNQTVVGTSMRTIADDLDGLALQAWVTTAFLIVSTITTPIYGKLSDLFGRRPLFIIAIVIFLAGSILSALANSMYELADLPRHPGPRRRWPDVAAAHDHGRHPRPA